ncbi:MAG: superoxide dismutase, partial [Pyrinomonadaceae bacterium]
MADTAKDQTYPFELPALEYDYDALDAAIDAETMKLHHDKHHQAYVDKLNEAVGKNSDLQKKTLSEILSDLDSVPEDIRGAVRNNGGG